MNINLGTFSFNLFLIGTRKLVGLISALPNLSKSISLQSDRFCGSPHLEDRFTKENHLLPCLLHNQVLYQKPFFIIAATTRGSQMNLPNSVLLVSCGTGD